MKKKSPARKKAAAESSPAPTRARSRKQSAASEVEEQLKIGREFMKKYRETLKALAKM